MRPGLGWPLVRAQEHRPQVTPGVCSRPELTSAGRKDGQAGTKVLRPGSQRSLAWLRERRLTAARPGRDDGQVMTVTSQAADGSGQQIKVFLLDDHEIVRRGVRDLLEAEPDIRVIGEAGTAASALARIPALRPDVAVLDMRLPDGDGVEVCREVRSRMPGVACLILTSFGDDEALFNAVMAGAAGYVLKQIHGSDLVGAVRTVAAGQSMLDPQAAGKLMARLRGQQKKHDPLAGLSPQERRILELIGDGLTNRQIGEQMFLAEKTVKNYVSALFAKLGMERRTQAAAFAARTFGDQPGRAEQ
jgi:DNA-binding NarL/FixJ family response regulator